MSDSLWQTRGKWTTSDFKRLQLHKYNMYINVQQSLVVTFEFRPTGAARGFMIISCAARGVKKLDITALHVPSHITSNINKI